MMSKHIDLRVVEGRRRLMLASASLPALAWAGAGALINPYLSLAQAQQKVWRIGFLSSESAAGLRTRVEALRAGLRDVGYVEGKNLVVEFRWAEGKDARLPELAAELVRLNIDVLVTHAQGVRAAKQTTTTIPIVMAASSDPVALGLVASLARPGGNITGSTFFPMELAAKRIELLKDAFPRITQVAVLVDLGSTVRSTDLQAMETAARSLKVTLHEFGVRGPHEFESAFAAMVKKRIGAVAVMEQPMFLVNAKAIADLAAKQRLPLIGNGEVAEAGGLIGYGANLIDLWHRAAYFVDRIFKGAKPGDLPIEQPTRFEFVVNLKTAKALGITLPQVIMVRANKVIE